MTLKPKDWSSLRVLLISGVVVLLITLAFTAAVFLGVIALVVLKRACTRRRSATTFGSATLATRTDFHNAGLLGEKGILVGRAMPERFPFLKGLIGLFRMPWAQSELACTNFLAAVIGASWSDRPLLRLPRSVHTLVCAPSGAGKNCGLVFPWLLMDPDSAVITDPKGENFNVTSANRKKRLGHEVHRLDPFGVCGAEGASCFNPLSILDARSDRLLDDARSLAEAIVVRTGLEQDSHWQDSSVDLITGVILYIVLADAPAEEKTLATCRMLAVDEVALEGVAATMIKSDIAGVRALGHHISSWKDRERSSIISTCAKNLSFVDSAPVAKSLSRSDFDPGDLIRRLMSIYLILPASLLQAQQRLLRIWLASFFLRLSAGPLQERNLVRFIIDEAGTLERLSALEQAVTLLRGYGVRAALCVQNLNQLSKIFPGEHGRQIVQSNMDQVFFGIRDLDTAKEISAWIGQVTVHSVSYQHGRSTTGSPLLSFVDNKQAGSVSKSEGVTHTETGRALIQPEEILKLPDDVVLVLAKGILPFACRRLTYWKDEAFKEALADQARAEPAAVKASVEANGKPLLLTGPAKLRLTCPNCHAALRSSAAARPGQTSFCPSCRTRVQLRRRRLRRNGTAVVHCPNPKCRVRVAAVMPAKVGQRSRCPACKSKVVACRRPSVNGKPQKQQS